MSTKSANGSPRDYGPPFDDAGADAVLRSADNIDFRVYRVILSKASPLFSTMFSLPQQDTSADTTSHKPTQNQSSAIAMSEHSPTLAHLLTLCYPFEDPSLTSLDDLALLLAASQKYEVARARATARRLFHSSPEYAANPIKAFRLAWAHRLELETRSAARKCLEGPMSLDAFGTELSLMEGAVAYQLSRYHADCCQALQDLWQSAAEGLPWITRAELTQSFVTALPSCPGIKIEASDGQHKVFTWLETYLNEAGDALVLRPASATATGEELLSKSHLRAVNCTGPDCRQYSMKALVMFSQRLAQEVDSRITAVRWPCPLSSSLQVHPSMINRPGPAEATVLKVGRQCLVECRGHAFVQPILWLQQYCFQWSPNEACFLDVLTNCFCRWSFLSSSLDCVIIILSCLSSSARSLTGKLRVKKSVRFLVSSVTKITCRK